MAEGDFSDQLRDVSMRSSAGELRQSLIDDDQDIETAARCMKAMAHPLRLKILCMVGCHTEVCVQDIVEHVGTSQSNISQHLSILRDKGILAHRKHANKVYYRIGDTRVVKLIDSLRDAFCKHQT